MLPSPLSDLANRYGAVTDNATRAALAAVADTTRGTVSPEAWRDAIAKIAPELLQLQTDVAGVADTYVAKALKAQGAGPAAGAVEVNAAGFADLTDGGGSWMRNLIYAPISTRAANRSLGVVEAQRRAQLVATSIVLSGIRDTGRAAIGAAMWSQGALHYVRVLNGVTCARCAVLAGRRYRVSAFQRHPRCDCRMVPAAEEPAESWAVDPKDYFRSLSTEAQNRVFTAAGAQAIRDGADISQVVNVRQGVTSGMAYGREVQVTTVGTTRRAVFGGYEVLEDGRFRKRADSELRRKVREGDRGSRYWRPKAPRLMPDEIYRLAEEFGWDRAEVLRQLRRFAYLL
ncbi:hypothetical protein [Amycolatopsis circi]|uniref:VG15 protein n=1 Tax=Amycolatopsis circi TaxID=871959 RepID=UPI000E2234C5|nr:hypothetical protein [Amycolatopsis circi]